MSLTIPVNSVDVGVTEAVKTASSSLSSIGQSTAGSDAQLRSHYGTICFNQANVIIMFSCVFRCCFAKTQSQ